MGLLDFFFPKRCVGCRAFGSYLCTVCFSTISFDVQEICLVCNRHAITGLTHPGCQTKYCIDGVFVGVVYKGIIKRVVYTLKYAPYLHDLKKIISDLLYESLTQKEALHAVLQKPAVLVPIPLHAAKMRKRGYNQAEIIAKQLSKRFDIPTVALLRRVKQTHTQVGLVKEQRQDNVKDAFALDTRMATDQELQVILVDDVVTSGATMLEASRVLKKAGFKKVYGIAFAHGQ